MLKSVIFGDTSENMQWTGQQFEDVRFLICQKPQREIEDSDDF